MNYEKAILQWNEFVTTTDGEFELSEITIYTYSSTINGFKEFLGEKGNNDVNEITLDDLNNYVTFLRRAKYKVTSIRSKLYVLKSFFYVLKSIGLIKENPTIDLHLPKKGKRKDRGLTGRKGLTMEEMNYLRQTLEEWRDEKGNKDSNQQRDQLVIELLYATGMRRRELTSKQDIWGIKINNVDLKKGTIIARRKGGFEQEIVITNLVSNIKEKIKVWIDKKQLKGNDKLFSIHDRTINSICKKWSKRADIKKNISSHQLRHTFGSHLGDLGVPAQTIQDLMDHISIVTTDQYIQTTKEGAMNILKRFGLYE